jgi:hypothetical protein
MAHPVCDLRQGREGSTLDGGRYKQILQTGKEDNIWSD